MSDIFRGTRVSRDREQATEWTVLILLVWFKFYFESKHSSSQSSRYSIPMNNRWKCVDLVGLSPLHSTRLRIVRFSIWSFLFLHWTILIQSKQERFLSSSIQLEDVHVDVHSWIFLSLFLPLSLSIQQDLPWSIVFIDSSHLISSIDESLSLRWWNEMARTVSICFSSFFFRFKQIIFCVERESDGAV